MTRCFFFCKDTNFLANHNSSSGMLAIHRVVSSFAKILIFQLITTVHLAFGILLGCFFFCKDTNFLANHNGHLCILPCRKVVSSFAKILIFQLITTPAFVSMQSVCCFFFCKDTNFLANHNTITIFARCSWVVSSFAKILIFQLITTFFLF